LKILKISALSGGNIGDCAISMCIEKMIDGDITSIDLKFKNLLEFPKNENIPGGTAKALVLSNIKKHPKIYHFLLNMYFKIFFIDKVKKLAKEYDALIIGGGNLLFNKNGINYLSVCYFFAKAFKEEGKSYSVVASGVGPFSCPYKKEVTYLAKNSMSFSVRDKFSKNIVLDVVGKEYYEKIELLEDPVIPYATLFSDHIDYIGGKHSWFAVNVIDLVNSPQKVKARQSLETIVDNIILISKALELEIKLVNTSFYDDPKTTEAIIKLFSSRNIQPPEILTIVLADIGNLSSLFSGCRFVLAYRMHLGILASSVGIPTFIFPWQHKVTGVFGNIYHQSMLVEDVNFSSEEIISRVSELDYEVWYSATSEAQSRVVTNYESLLLY